MATNPSFVSGLPILPQVPYAPETAILQHDTIDFEQASSGLGVNLRDAHEGLTRVLSANCDRPAFNLSSMGVNSKITIRIQIVGLEPYFRQVPAIRANRTADSISLGKLAMTIAQEMQRCMERHGVINYDNQPVELENMVLTKLYHVSRGSWQPEIRVNFA